MPESTRDPLDAQLSDLFAYVLKCEQDARREDRIDAALKYGKA